MLSMCSQNVLYPASTKHVNIYPFSERCGTKASTTVLITVCHLSPSSPGLLNQESLYVFFHGRYPGYSMPKRGGFVNDGCSTDLSKNSSHTRHLLRKVQK